MKKRLIILSAMFIITISLLFGGLAAVRNVDFGSGSNNHHMNDETIKNPLKIEEELTLEVAQEISFNDENKKIFIDSITDEEIANLTYEVEDPSVIYLTKNKHKIIGLKAGTSLLTISSDKYYVELNVVVKTKNLCEPTNLGIDGTLENLTVGSKWTSHGQDHGGWKLWMSNCTNGDPVHEGQEIEVVEERVEGKEETNKVIHIKHTANTQYTNLVREVKLTDYDLEPGQYYAVAKMKGQDIEKDAYVRVNQSGSLGVTQTQKVKGSFEWTEYQSEVFRIAEGQPTFKLELYFALNKGEVWFDDLQVYRVITTDYTSFTVSKPVEKVEVGADAQIKCETYPASVVDYQYYYESSDETIVEVDEFGKIIGVNPGVAKVTVTDSLYGMKKEVLVIVGTENGIHASVNGGENNIVLEDRTAVLQIDVEDSDNYTIYKYNEPVYGNYYIKDNNIVYTPKADYYSHTKTDAFTIIVFDAEKGYCLVTVTVEVYSEYDTPTYVEFWHTTDKNTDLIWGTENNTNYSAEVSPSDYNADEFTTTKLTSEELSKDKLLISSGGYLQVECEDIEVLYPGIYKKNLGNGQLAAKTALYKNLIVTSVDNTLTLVTENGGTVNIRLNGVVQEIHDRYNATQGKIIYGALYDYMPKEGFYGYDYFYLLVQNGDKVITVKNTVYVAPGTEDYKFDELDLSGVYLLTNDEWINEVKQGYQNNDPYITKWVEYYEAQYVIHVPAGVPADARTPMEQLAILYQITGKEEYFQACWSEIEPVVKDEAYSAQYLGNETRRLSWGQDSNGFLDAAMVTYSVAFAYNFIKDKLTDAQKEIVMKALYEEGFYYFKNLNNPNVLLHGNNHNLLVCGDLAVAALSAMSYTGNITVDTRDHGKYEINVQEMAAETVTTAFKYLQIGLVHYAENGGFPEGPSYSIYAHRNMVSLLSTLDNLYGKDENGNIYSFGLSSIEGIINYTNYPLYTSSPNYESFYYAESDYSNNQPALLWYTRLDESNYNAALLSKLADEREQYNIQALLYYKPGLFERVDASKIQELDYLLDEHELATFRSAFGNEMAIFTGLKGTNSDSGAFAHKNLDSGTFELYALGERFIGNYSNETYNVVVPDGYWDYDYQRWTYYKKSAQGQNTLVFNPEKNPVIQQDPYEKAPIIRFESNATSGLSIIDLSRVYKSDAISVQRGLKLFDNRSTVMVQDEFKLRDYSTVYWSAHTEARIELLSDKIARLTLNGKSVYAIINSELGEFYYMSANTPLPGTQGDFCNLDNDGVNKLVIKLEDVLEGTLNVVFVASLEAISNFKTYKVVELDKWKLDSEETNVGNITVDNISFDADLGKGYKYIFNNRQYEYVVKLSETTAKVPTLNVKYDETKYDVTVSMSKAFGSLSKVTVKDKTTGKSVTYKYKFIVDTKISGYEEYVENLVASFSGHKEINKILDGENGTSITAYETQELIFQFEDTIKLTDVLIRFAGGKINTYYFDIYTSVDGINYECVYFGGQNSNGLGDEVYAIGVVDAKYVKLVFNGEIRGDRVSITDVKFLTNEEATKEPVDHTKLVLTIVFSVLGGVLVLGAAFVLVVAGIGAKYKHTLGEDYEDK